MGLLEEGFIIKLSEATLEELARCSSREERGKRLMSLIDTEIDKMNQWCEENLEGAGAKFENAYLRTYLYRKITGELEGLGDIESLPQNNISSHPALHG